MLASVQSLLEQYEAITKQQVQTAVEGSVADGVTAGPEKLQIMFYSLQFVLCAHLGKHKTLIDILAKNCFTPQQLLRYTINPFATLHLMMDGTASLPLTDKELRPFCRFGALSQTVCCPDKEVATLAYRSALQALANETSPLYKTICFVLRQLIGLAEQVGDAKEAYRLYREATQLIVGRAPEEIPQDEIHWLLVTSWNKSVMPVKLGKHAEAAKWMNTSLELLRLAPHLPGLETLKPQMIHSYERLKEEQGKQATLASSMEE